MTWALAVLLVALAAAGVVVQGLRHDDDPVERFSRFQNTKMDAPRPTVLHRSLWILGIASLLALLALALALNGR